MVPPASRPITRVGRYSGTQLRHLLAFHYRAITVSGAPFQATSCSVHCRVRWSYNPGPTRRPVWPVPVSLATTRGISFDFSSSGYLDVSVPLVRSTCVVTAPSDGRVSPFGHRGINACVPLPRAYRSLPRPSSPLCAQASPTYVRSLDPVPSGVTQTVSSLQAKHALLRTSERVTEGSVARPNRSTTSH